MGEKEKDNEHVYRKEPYVFDFDRMKFMVDGKEIELSTSTADDKDIRYIGNEFSDTVRQKFGKKDRGTAKTKLPTPVSKSAAKSGALAYDPNTLASRFTTMYPELREMYKANIEKYGDFLAEEFFREYGTPAAMQTIRQNDKQRMKKLFNTDLRPSAWQLCILCPAGRTERACQLLP